MRLVRSMRLQRGINKMEDYKIKHCESCGAELVIIKSDDFHFDAETGEPIFKAQLRCPNKQQRFWHADGHSSWDGTLEDNKFIFSDKYRMWY